MKVEIDIDQYFTEDDVRDLIKDEIRYYVEGIVNDYFLHRSSYSDFIVAVARDAYWDAVGKLDEDTMGMLRRQVRKEVMNLSIFSLIGTKYNFSSHKEEPTALQKIIDEESEKVRPEIAEMIRSSALSKIRSDGADILTDAFYHLVSRAFDKD